MMIETVVPIGGKRFAHSKMRSSLRMLYPTDVSATYVVPKAGLEPARSCPRGILSPLRLPFRHFGAIGGTTQIRTGE